MVQNISQSLKMLSRCKTQKLLRPRDFRRQLATATAVNILTTPDCTVAIKKDIESYWKERINSYNYAPKDDADKFYVLSMFPYPSGALHMGHIRVYTISDTVARFYRLKGKNVIHPMGWDAFGLPAENAAAERNVDPAIWTDQNIMTMRDQLRMMNYSFDWHREFATCDPDYYKWTQELFLRLYEKGLAYRKEAYVNWDPVDQTVLAEEQVDLNHRSWRSGAIVEKKLLKQWFIRTTAFAKDLWEGLQDPTLKEWRDIIKIQRHWIGECTGVNVDFQVVSEIPDFPETVDLWTDAPAFIEHAKFVAVSPQSVLHREEHARDLDVGVKGLNARAVNPFSGEELPIFVTDRVVYPPWRDTRLGVPSASMDDARFCELVGIPFTRHPIRSHEEQRRKLTEVLEEARRRGIGGYPVSSRLRDWLISRQRYWGTPIPVVHCASCGTQPVPRADLPVTLPMRHAASAGKFSLHEARSWLKTSCPGCGGEATREADTMDTFVDSSWYYLRFVDPDNAEEMFSAAKVRKQFPIDLYIGGKEHAVLHLYYARFVSHFLHSEGLLPCREPFRQLLVQGVVMGKTYKVRSTGKYVPETEVVQNGNEECATKNGEPVVVSWEKMSKSKHNGIDPLNLLGKYGVDTTRLLMLADVAPTSTRNWSENTVPGVRNWMYYLWTTVRHFRIARDEMSPEELRSAPTDPNFAEQDARMFEARNYFLKKVTFNIVVSQQFSVAISRMQGLTNSLRKVKKTECSRKGREYERALAAQIIMLAPFAPHFASELWANFRSARHHLIDGEEVNLGRDVLEQKWPEIDRDYKLELNVFMNKRQYLKLKIPRHRLDEMTAQTALEHVILDPYYQKNAQNKTIVDVDLQSERGCDASLYIVTTEKRAGNTVAQSVVTDTR